LHYVPLSKDITISTLNLLNAEHQGDGELGACDEICRKEKVRMNEKMNGDTIKKW